MTGSDDVTLVVDLGKSGWRARAHAGSHHVDAAGAPGVDIESTGRSMAGSGLAAFVEAAAEATLGSDRAPRTVIVASTAIPAQAEIERWVQTLSLRWPAAMLIIGEDGVMGHAAALGGPGVYASIGTGAIIVGMDQLGRIHRIDGWGPDLGDRGAAFDLGRLGLRVGYATEDGVANAPRLHKAAASHLGGLTLEAANRLASNPHRAAHIADFAKIVCDLAHEDDRSLELVTDAALTMAQSIAESARRSDAKQVALLGRLARHPMYHEILVRDLDRKGLEVVPPRWEVLDLSVELLHEPYRSSLAMVSHNEERGPR